MIVLCGHWRMGAEGGALGREPLASPAAPADGPGPHQHLRLTARRTRQRASTLAHVRRRTDRRRIGPGMPTLHRHWHRAALGREPLASPAAPADRPGLHQLLRLTARRTPLRASTLAQSRRRTDRRRVGSACGPSIGTSTGPHPAGRCSPAPRRQRASLVSCGTFGSRSSRCIPRHPATSSDTRAMRIVRGSRGGR